jgi:serine/threonine protein kinase
VSTSKLLTFSNIFFFTAGLIVKMNHFRAFTNSIASAARDLTRDLSTKLEEKSASVGKQYSIGGKVLQEERLISEGGFGFVYLAREISTNEQYVLKKMLCQDKERYDLACREVEILEKLPLHANLVKYYGHIIEKDSRHREVILLLEFCPGGHVYDMMLKYQGAVPAEVIMKVLRDVTAGLVALHGMMPPIQHRDLKLENVLLSSSGNYVLLDFGSWSSEAPDLSTLPRDELMKFGEVVERYTTLMYRPPEMADLYKGFKISGKVDIWMLGCILFTLINNKHPFQNASNLAIVNCRYQFDQSECKRYSPKLVELCAWLLAQNPDDRPTASHLEQLLQRWEDRIEEPLNLPKQVMERIEKDARLYGIPSAGRRKEAKPCGEVQAAVTAGQTAWGSVDASVEPKGWQANFTTDDNLLDISNASSKKVESIPDLLG